MGRKCLQRSPGTLLCKPSHTPPRWRPGKRALQRIVGAYVRDANPPCRLRHCGSSWIHSDVLALPPLPR